MRGKVTAIGVITAFGLAVWGFVHLDRDRDRVASHSDPTSTQDGPSGCAIGPKFVTATVLNVRGAPGAKELSGKIKKGDRVTVLSCNGEWAKLGAGRWVHSAFLLPIDPRASPSKARRFRVLRDEAISGVRADRFDVIVKRRGKDLYVRLDTDLPENTTVMASIKRLWYEQGKSAAYSRSYFDKRGRVSEWKRFRKFNVAHAIWKGKLKAHQEKMSRLGIGFTVGRVSDDIEVSFVVPISQKNPSFGPRNKNLFGKTVQLQGKGTKWEMRIIRRVVKVRYPLTSTSGLKRRSVSLDPYTLEVNATYILSRRTPLVDSPAPKDPLAAIARMRDMPSGSKISIRRSAKVKGGLWYRVIATNRDGQRIGSGWVNSIALVGQKLRVAN